MSTVYVVLDERSRPMTLSNYGGRSPILAIGDEASFFMTYDAARSAIRRTKRFERRNGYRWNTDACLIMRLKSAQP